MSNTLSQEQVEELWEEAGELYEAYRGTVVFAFNGDKLPNWETILKDENKRQIIEGWISVARRAMYG